MRSILHIIKEILLLLYLCICYRIALFRLRKLGKKKSINVFFFVSEIAKWKAQSLYELMEMDNRFVPMICVYPMRKELDLLLSEQSKSLEEKISYFQAKKMRVVSIWDVNSRSINRSMFKSSGLIFYQQPWDVPPAPTPLQIAMKYLTFYIPYYLVNNYDKRLELCMSLQRQVFRYIVPSETIKEFYLKQVCKYKFAGKLIGLGHTCTDISHSMVRTKKDFTVIYAPHFSFPCNYTTRPLYYSTFLDNGEFILEYAKKHKEIKWIFKPHPRLKSELEVTGTWSKEKILRYYEEWEIIGESCYTSDYLSLFVNSDVMLTDCGSFLTEYACTKNPIIRMVSPLLKLSPNPVLEELYSTYYCVHDNKELEKALDLLVIRRDDPNKQRRCNAIEKIGFGNNSSAENIRDYISKLLHI